jgi:hypothetical protein
MDVDVAREARHQRFTLACRHDLDPKRSSSAAPALQVLQGSHVMHLDVIL